MTRLRALEQIMLRTITAAQRLHQPVSIRSGIASCVLRRYLPALTGCGSLAASQMVRTFATGESSRAVSRSTVFDVRSGAVWLADTNPSPQQPNQQHRPRTPATPTAAPTAAGSAQNNKPAPNPLAGYSFGSTLRPSVNPSVTTSPASSGAPGQVQSLFSETSGVVAFQAYRPWHFRALTGVGITSVLAWSLAGTATQSLSSALEPTIWNNPTWTVLGLGRSRAACHPVPNLSH